MESVLGSKLVSSSGANLSTAEALAGKEVIGIYFSAHWCPPCRGFTPDLKKFYETYKDSKKFEIIFASSDRDENQFRDYFHGEMPWLAVPFEDRARKSQLEKKFKVKSIPTLVLLDKDGNLITTNGREGINSMNAADQFPYREPTLKDILPKIVFQKNGEEKLVSPDEYILLYFSAHWCPPCRGFTPKLADWYEQNENMEIIFCSSDRELSDFETYRSQMPFAALPFKDRETKEKLSKYFKIQGIPSLILLSPEDPDTKKRDLITTDGRSCVLQNLKFPDDWRPKPYADIAVDVACKDSEINDCRSLVVLADALDNHQENAVNALKEIATRHKTNLDLLFYFATEAKGPVPRLRELTGTTLDSNKLTVLIVDIPADAAFHTKDFDPTDPDLHNKLQNFLDNPGPTLHLGQV